MHNHQSGRQAPCSGGNGAVGATCKHGKPPKQDQLDCPYRIKQTLGNNNFSNYVTCCADSDQSSLADSRRCRDSMSTAYTDCQEDHQNRNGFCGPLSWSFFPIVISITTSVGFIVTYTFAKTNCHIERWIFPYLSYTGTEHPESMIFGLILNIEGFFGLIVVFLAWRFYRHMGQKNCINSLALVLGTFSCFGVIMVGNFQVTKAKVPHYIGAGLAFIIGTGYGVLTSLLSWRSFRVARPSMKYSTCVSFLRCACAMLMVTAIVLLSGVAMYKKLSHRHESSKPNFTDPLMFVNGSCRDLLSKIPLHVQYVDLLGSITEWILTACLLICLSLYTYEFRAFQNVKVILYAQAGPLQSNNYNCNRKRKSEFLTQKGDVIVVINGTKPEIKHQHSSSRDNLNHANGDRSSELNALLSSNSSYKSSSLCSDSADVTESEADQSKTLLISDDTGESPLGSFTV